MEQFKNKELIKTIFMEEAFHASAAKVFGVDKNSYHFKNLETAFEQFFQRATKNERIIERIEKLKNKSFEGLISPTYTAEAHIYYRSIDVRIDELEKLIKPE
jgi:hypothetical protein